MVYSSKNDKSIVIVYFFKSNGEWYTTYQMRWIKNGYLMEDIYEAFAKTLRDFFRNHGVASELSKDLDAVCVNPYHKNAFPVQLKAGKWRTYETKSG